MLVTAVECRQDDVGDGGGVLGRRMLVTAVVCLAGGCWLRRWSVVRRMLVTAVECRQEDVGDGGGVSCRWMLVTAVECRAGGCW